MERICNIWEILVKKIIHCIWNGNLHRCPGFYLATLPKKEMGFLKHWSKWGERFSLSLRSRIWKMKELSKLIHKCIKYLLSIYFILSTVGITGHSVAKKKSHGPIQANHPAEERDNKNLNKQVSSATILLSQIFPQIFSFFLSFSLSLSLSSSLSHSRSLSLLLSLTYTHTHTHTHTHTYLHIPHSNRK